MAFDSLKKSDVPPFRRRLAQLPARAKAWLGDGGHHSLAQRTAGMAFLIRVASAAFLYLSQIVLARWMGGFEFGVYVAVWTWVLVVGDILNFGLASAAQRLIPEYTQRRAFEHLRGFLAASRWFVFAAATLAALLGAFVIRIGEAWLPAYMVVPLYFACVALPFYALSNMLDGIARSYNWVNLALAPPYIVRPLLLLGAMAAAHAAGLPANAQTAMLAAVVATWAATILQLFVLHRRLARNVPAGAKASDAKTWMGIALPIVTVWVFFTLLAYTDVLVLQQFRAPEEVGIYYVAAKTLALAAFVHFSIGVAVAHRFSEYNVTGDRVRLAAFVAGAIRWTFWPSLAAIVAVLAFGRALLWLFGPAFVAGYPLMGILSIGLLARASVGPAERLLNMLGEQRACALVYGAAFAVNIAACLVLIPPFGATGAAIATAGALVVESLLLFLTIRRRLGIHSFIWQWPAAGRSSLPALRVPAAEVANTKAS